MIFFLERVNIPGVDLRELTVSVKNSKCVVLCCLEKIVVCFVVLMDENET